jgi:hypothetical protein
MIGYAAGGRPCQDWADGETIQTDIADTPDGKHTAVEATLESRSTAASRTTPCPGSDGDG